MPVRDTHEHDSNRSRHLEEILLSDPDRLLDEVSLADIALAWCCYQERVPETDDDPDWWAVDAWLAGTVLPPDQIREGLRLLIETADETVLGMVGAGPLEDFVSDDEGDLRWVEEMAARSRQFRIALRSVWASGLSEGAAARIDAAAREPA